MDTTTSANWTGHNQTINLPINSADNMSKTEKDGN